jgi:hypothetical protein
MLKENNLIGALLVYRQEVRPFSEQTDYVIAKLRGAGCHRNGKRAAGQRTAREN